MKKLKYVCDNFEKWIMMVLFTALFLVVIAGIVTRVIFHNPLSWTEEAARIIFIWLVFFGISYGTKYDKHINVTIVLDKMPEKMKAFMTLFWDVVALVVFVWMAFRGAQYIQYMSGSVTSVLRWNQGVTTSIVAVSSILNCIRIIENIVTRHLPEFNNCGKEKK